MLVMGIGGGITFNPLLLAAMGMSPPTEAGLASGIVNTAFMMGGALGLAVLASLAASRTDSLLGSGESALVALNRGYHAAFLAGAGFAAAGLAGALLLRPVASPAHGMEEAPVEAEPAQETAWTTGCPILPPFVIELPPEQLGEVAPQPVSVLPEERG